MDKSETTERELGSLGQGEKKREGWQDLPEEELLSRRMGEIDFKIMVLSGKGGVGKSTVAARMAVALALSGERVGLLDADIHGPSIPKLFGVEGCPLMVATTGIQPLQITPKLKLMSIGFLLDGRDSAIIWRGPLKHNALKQFLAEVEWGRLDYLVIDCPPGTGDEPLTVAKLMNGRYGAVIVTTPQDLALADVRRSVSFCRQLSLPVLGVVENMSGFVCPRCGEITNIFKVGGGEAMAKEMGIPFLARVPIDPKLVEASDSGKPFPHSDCLDQTDKAFASIVLSLLKAKAQDTASPVGEGGIVDTEGGKRG